MLKTAANVIYKRDQFIFITFGHYWYICCLACMVWQQRQRQHHHIHWMKRVVFLRPTLSITNPVTLSIYPCTLFDWLLCVNRRAGGQLVDSLNAHSVLLVHSHLDMSNGKKLPIRTFEKNFYDRPCPFDTFIRICFR